MMAMPGAMTTAFDADFFLRVENPAEGSAGD